MIIVLSRPIVAIENWYFAYGRLCGNVYGHPMFPNGEWVTTSTVLARGERSAITRNTAYVLGSPAQAV